MVFLESRRCGFCTVTGGRKKDKGLEVLCIYTFSGPHKLLKKLETLLVDTDLAQSIV